ncbi:EAL domain-containing protein [Pelagibius marinus]|uniref:EAL domain-containing protein n=1 Tax=Pelagibius marinus TaxID=2762760 RepID=UPI001872DB49|nr:EAL domain-containing protein [Pelagibius marinus]
MLKHLAIFLCYAGGAVALTLFAPLWLPLSGPEAAIGLGLAALIGGGLLHEVFARLGRESFLVEKLIGLRHAQSEALEELSWTRRELAILREALESAGSLSRSGKSVDEVISEVKVLQSLITRLAKSSKAPSPAGLGTPKAAAPAMAEPARRSAEAPPRGLPLRDDEGGKIAVMPANANQRPGVLPPVAEGLDEAAVLEVARQALRDDRIDLVLQPIVLLPQRKRRYYECFSRLRTTDGYMILPEQYIGLAEREGIVAAIDNMLLIRCIQLVRKIQYRSEKLDFFCNISSHTLGDDAFFADFVDFLESNGDLAKHLIFEFSQSDYEAWDSGAAVYLRRLAELGCRFSLDGMHHLNVDGEILARRNFHFVKVHAELLLADAAAGEALVNDLKEHGVRLVVEKVEDEDALVEVMDLGVDCAQGYLFGEPRLAKPAA